MYSLIFFRPTSPSFWSFSSAGTTLASSWKMIDAEMYGMMPRPKMVLWLSVVPPSIERLPSAWPNSLP